MSGFIRTGRIRSLPNWISFVSSEVLTWMPVSNANAHTRSRSARLPWIAAMAASLIHLSPTVPNSGPMLTRTHSFTAQKLRELRERIGAVEIVGVDDGEVFLHRLARAPHGVAGAPGFLAARGRRKARRERIERLKHVVDGDFSGVARADLRAKQFLKIATDHEDHAAKCGDVLCRITPRIRA